MNEKPIPVPMSLTDAGIFFGGWMTDTVTDTTMRLQGIKSPNLSLLYFFTGSNF